MSETKPENHDWSFSEAIVNDASRMKEREYMNADIIIVLNSFGKDSDSNHIFLRLIKTNFWMWNNCFILSSTSYPTSGKISRFHVMGEERPCRTVIELSCITKLNLSYCFHCWWILGMQIFNYNSHGAGIVVWECTNTGSGEMIGTWYGALVSH